MIYLKGNLKREERLFMSFQIGELFNLEYWQQMFSGDLFSLNFLVNILDILVVWYLVYKLIQLLRGTKAIQLLKGVAIFIVIRIAAELIGRHLPTRDSSWVRTSGKKFVIQTNEKRTARRREDDPIL